jgi:hypothetical protein
MVSPVADSLTVLASAEIRHLGNAIGRFCFPGVSG